MIGHFNKGNIDDYDYSSDMIIAHREGQCVGGLRLTTVIKKKGVLLPSESVDWEFSDAFPEYDFQSSNILAVKNNKCIGGVRLTCLDKTTNSLLPSECDELSFQEIFKDYKINGSRIGEIHRLVVNKKFRNKILVRGLLWNLYISSVMEGADYLLTPSIVIRARLYEILSNSFGVKTKVLYSNKIIISNILFKK